MRAGEVGGGSFFGLMWLGVVMMGRLRRKRQQRPSDGVVGAPVETGFPVQDSTWAEVHALTRWALVQFWASSVRIVEYAWGSSTLGPFYFSIL